MTDHKPIRYLSLGWGVQSTTLAAMIALGELPPIDLAIHADTTHDSAATYAYARKWTPWLAARGVKIVTVRNSNNDVLRPEWAIRKDPGAPAVMIPAFTLSKADGDHGQTSRKCTREWKINPIRRHVRSLLPPGNPRPGAVHSLQGISLDEWTRMRTSDVKYIINTYPLVDLRMTRADCVLWLQRHRIETPPKSACTFCPFHRRSYWQELKRAGGPDWEEALETDNQVRDTRDQHFLYVHPARLPLEQAVSIPEDSGVVQLDMDLPCDGGVCFV